MTSPSILSPRLPGQLAPYATPMLPAHMVPPPGSAAQSVQRGTDALTIPPRRAAAQNTVNVLSLDGAGAWGVREAVILREIERRMGMPIAQIFQFVAGTSSGGLVATCLTRPNPFTAEQVVELFRTRASQLFKRSLWHTLRTANGIFGGPKFPDTGLTKVGKEVYGDLRMSDAVTDLMLTGHELRLGPVGMTSFPVGPGCADHTMFDAARGSAAFPALFTPGVLHTLGMDTPVMRLFDGGFWATNPAPFGLMLAMMRNPQARHANVVAISAGSVVGDTPMPELDNKGVLQMTPYILTTSIVNNRGVAEAQMPQYMQKGDWYARLAPPVITKEQDPKAGIGSFDDGSRDSMDRNIAQTEVWLARNSGLIDEICDRLWAGLTSGPPRGAKRPAPAAAHGFSPVTTRMFGLPAPSGATVIEAH